MNLLELAIAFFTGLTMAIHITPNITINKFLSINDLKLITNNFLITSSLLVIFGLLASISKVFNILSFYILGLNKTGMNSIISVDGNAWRGLAPSAEGIGEFYDFVFLSDLYEIQFHLLIYFECCLKVYFF